jgi:hypothetical protein
MGPRRFKTASRNHQNRKIHGAEYPFNKVLFGGLTFGGGLHRFPTPWCCAQVDANPRLAEAPRACAALLAGHDSH